MFERLRALNPTPRTRWSIAARSARPRLLDADPECLPPLHEIVADLEDQIEGVAELNVHSFLHRLKLAAPLKDSRARDQS